MGARPYDPTTGRFLTTDPIPGGSLNNYDYADQDPINNYDLNGNLAEVAGDEGAGLGPVGGIAYDPYEPGVPAEDALPGAPIGKSPSRIYYDREYVKEARQRGTNHIFNNAQVREVIENGQIGKYDPSRTGRPYVQYELQGSRNGKTVTYEVGGYWTGNAFKVTHRFYRVSMRAYSVYREMRCVAFG
jgi:hypothetical protein